ncbi:hypothetical protein CS301_02455 [Bacillus velezensis]|nr:hypothetical protein CS301_02455 [Bacillus velezensis]
MEERQAFIVLGLSDYFQKKKQPLPSLSLKFLTSASTVNSSWLSSFHKRDMRIVTKNNIQLS